jgi:hypothetical protein
MSRCVVPGCECRQERNIPFFGLPKDEQRKTKWINALDLETDTLPKNARICIRHFPSSHLKDTKHRMILQDWAMPRIEAYGSDESELVSK